MLNSFAGRRYIWSGSDFAWTTTSQARHLLKGTGDTLVDAGTTSPPFTADATKWILSDDLHLLGARTASVRIKATKTSQAAYTAGSHVLNAIGTMGPLELGLNIPGGTPPAFSNAFPIRISSYEEVASAGQIPYATANTGTASGVTAYQHFHFLSNGTGQLGVVPYRFIGFYLRLVAHATNDPTDPASHTWQFEAQWYYTMDSSKDGEP